MKICRHDRSHLWRVQELSRPAAVYAGSRCRARAGAGQWKARWGRPNTEREVAKESASRSASVSTQCCEGGVEHVRTPLDQVEAFPAVAEDVRFGHRRHHVQPWNDGSKARERRRRRRSGRFARERGELDVAPRVCVHGRRWRLHSRVEEQARAEERGHGWANTARKGRVLEGKGDYSRLAPAVF